ncbi:MAG: YihY/virulence factor BrkB family protein [Lachnospiraceae bacterium]|nr:YihY/virulence factor BrkB family protein [Lachnospiraceae bacterium]
MIKKIVSFLNRFFTKASDDSLAAYAAQTTFYVMLSFFPFIIFVFILASKVSFINTDIINYILDIAPDEFRDYIMFIVDDIVYSNSRSFTIITILVILWSAGKGLQALTNGLDKIYQVEKKKNFVLVRLLSILYIFVFMIMMSVLVVIHIFGAGIARRLISEWPALLHPALLILSLKNAFTFIVTLIFILLIYYQLPNRKGKFMRELPGATFSAFLWMLITSGFSFYIRHVSNTSYMYGSLTSIILILMWLYICLQVVFFGAEINYFITPVFDRSDKKKRDKKDKKKSANVDT